MVHSTPSTYTKLTDLPPELYCEILDHASKLDLQRTTVALLRAIPHSPVPRHFAFRYVRLTRPAQIIQLYQVLRKEKHIIPRVEAFSLETWVADADAVVNLMQLLVAFGNVNEVKMFIGPNFAPEHLEEIFKTPWENLQLLSLRFRPYVQRATYYQFLAGAYFDTTLLALAKWPGEDCLLPKLSIIQDPLDPSIAPTGKFAQPMVFFALEPIKKLAVSELSYEVKNLRLRVPARQLARFLYNSPDSYPALRLLDLSTSHVSEGDIECIMGRFGTLEHLILDGSGVISHRADIEEEEWKRMWVRLGRIMAASGLKLAKEREKKLKEWLELQELQAIMEGMQVQEGVQPVHPRPTRRPRKGRKGLASSTISLRDSRNSHETPPSKSLPEDPRPGRGEPSDRPRLRIMPPQPRLRTISVNVPEYRKAPGDIKTLHSTIRAEFARGWVEGLAIIASRRRLLLQTWRNGGKIYLFRHHTSDSLEVEEELDAKDENGLQGLVEMASSADFDIRANSCPDLCLAGSGKREAEHNELCGHSAGWSVWDDDL